MISETRPLARKRIILGITGGIAAYKAAFLLRELQKLDAEVRCIMTPSALRFLGKDTMSALSRQPVPVDVFPQDSDVAESWSRHIQWAEWADAMLIAPCTANTLAKIVHGLSDNMLTSTVLAARCPVMICPTMDGGMYEAPSTRRNRALAAEYGYHLIEPGHGYLASGLEDTGRLPEFPAIIDALEKLFPKQNGNAASQGALSGKRVLITAGPTREYADAVRFLSNPSTGKMGFAMAEAAMKLGAEVTLVHGRVALSPPKGAAAVPVVSAQDLFEAVKSRHEAHDVFILAAAVSDFRPANRASHKVKKEGAELLLKLEKTPDTLQWLGENKLPHQTLIGFAMETEELVKQASEKRKRKKADFMVGNTIGRPGTGFEADTNDVLLIGERQGQEFTLPLSGSKLSLSETILSTIFGSDGFRK
ncbi:MAG: bifunctional phosphopantothenoylcysteine decarboxylase/phosphopantothenate--cysteine ligase CoaBC [Candidatus Cyclonatronum sp.]|uniref:bifunctional phosphopantothenoylcysteine decarboxylase/phosphopantothenate--cysteine ligase CoaBC n=1 Tax=Cyclonatronum sp. TaxID=3024185 RepID=UPI0025BC5862|nr:bifunctional phosphopantothenoylcysteine decarboxylase/phosphopantothenate--cysteine ligase CoaBC [Cyclonatronum sp.]MCC5933636.1 bifunctional phosphopantothenoylcysteine decarboxylase/phosphopantothenate--cysteine ligase CoaBC [Balneolales bacterium]MCH8485920.1 bifunctional phosphopantothenoylcysteine decarboxylase/phosphopantothenate--cysteine ligase CoaBC [Cyclonatronum sp.]